MRDEAAHKRGVNHTIIWNMHHMASISKHGRQLKIVEAE